MILNFHEIRLTLDFMSEIRYNQQKLYFAFGGTVLKKLSFVLVLIGVLILFGLSTGAETPIYAGTCGADGDGSSVTWSFDMSTGELTISGSGAIKDYTNNDPAPWYQYRTDIKSIVINNGITTIGQRAFNESAATSVTMADSVTKIRGYAFRVNSNLTSLTLSKNVKTIGEYAFISCKALKTLVLPGTITEIGTGVFQTCTKLESLTIENGFKKIGNKAFMGCTSLSEVVLPETVTHVGVTSGAFMGCTSLQKITFLSSSTVIPDAADSFSDVTEFYCLEDSTAEAYAKKYNRSYVVDKPSTTVSGFCGAEGDGSSVEWLFDTATGVLTISGEGAIADYTEDAPSPWNEYRSVIKSVVIQDGVTTIGKRAFSEHAIESVTMADSVTAIKGYSFRVCSNLAEIKLSKNLQTIGEYAFTSCKALKSLILPSTLTSVGSHAFQKCSSLSNLTLEEGIVSIYSGVFAECTSLKEVIVPSSVTRVGETKGAFYRCSGLEKIIFLSPYTLIPDNADALPENTVIYGFSTSTAKNYAEQYSREISEFADFNCNGITVLEIKGSELKAESGEYMPIASLRCMNAASFPSVELLFVNQNGELCFKNADGSFLTLSNRGGESLVLNADSKVSIIYDNLAGCVRYYFNQTTVTSNDASTVEFQIDTRNLARVNAYAVILELADKVELISTDSISCNAPKFIGFQTHSEDDTKIRIIAGVDMLYYNDTGFNVSLYSNGILQKEVVVDSKNVFSSVVADESDLTAESLGFEYLSAVVINDINCSHLPKDAEIYFAVKPYVTIGEEKIYGEERKIMIFYDFETKQHSYKSDDAKIDLNGKKILVIGNSFVYYGKAVIKKDAYSVTSQAARANDKGFFYQLCKENGFDVSITNWTYGGHTLHDMRELPCSIEKCAGRIHLDDLVETSYDYVFISSGSGEFAESVFAEDIEFFVNFFRRANPAVKFVYLGNLGAYGYSSSKYLQTGILNYYKTLEDKGFTVVDWGTLVNDIIEGNVSVPNAKQTYEKRTFIVKDNYHQNALAGYITSLMTYCAITGESPVDQPYKFCYDSSINKEFDMEQYINDYYVNGNTNFLDVFKSESDMLGIQKLISDYLASKPYRDFQFEN